MIKQKLQKAWNWVKDKARKFKRLIIVLLLGGGLVWGASINVLNIHSHPQVGEFWTVSFETTGLRDLIITPTDQNSIDDLDFVSLKCGDEERTPQILENDVIFYPNWFCLSEGEITHKVNVAREHHLEFQFGDQVSMAYNNPGIAYDTHTGFSLQTSSATLTFSHTCTGDDLILFVGGSVRSSKTITGVTYNGVPMTQSGNAVGTTNILNYLFYLINPATGANNVVITQSAADYITGCSISYTGVKQTDQPDATSEGGPTTTGDYSQSVTTVADNSWAVLYGDANGGLTLTAGANTYIRNQPEILFTGAFLTDTNSAKTPAGTDTMNVTSNSQMFAGCMASFAPVYVPPVRRIMDVE